MRAWEGRVLAMQRAMGALGAWNIDMAALRIEKLPPDIYLGVVLLREMGAAARNAALARGLVGADELEAGHALRPASRCRTSSRPPTCRAC